jgi:hypothetical protein
MDGETLLEGLRARLQERLPGIARIGGGLRAPRATAYGAMTLRIDWDADAESCRVGVSLPPPAGGGPGFLVFCLATTAQYWDVKIGLDDDGMLVVHADVEAAPDDDLDVACETLVARADTISELINDDLVPYLVEHELGTPAQRARWSAAAKHD